MDIGAAMNTPEAERDHVVVEAPQIVNIHGHQHQCVIRYFTTAQTHKNVKTRPTWRGRFRDGSAFALTKEQKMLKNRLAVRESVEKKKAQFLEMEEELKRLYKENAAYAKLLNVLSENQNVDTRRQLQRTLSAPI